MPLVSGYAILGIQGPVGLDEFSEPEPDIILLRPRADFYRNRHAGPKDILLIVEVADSSLEFDRQVKGSLYAETGVQEYWIADLRSDSVWAYSDIRDGAYQTIRQFHRGDVIVPELLPECPIPVDALLP